MFESVAATCVDDFEFAVFGQELCERSVMFASPLLVVSLNVNTVQ